MKARCTAAPTCGIERPREIEAMRSIHWARWLSTSHLIALHYGSRRIAQRRLRVLFDRGLVRARLQGDALFHRDNLYALTAGGIRRLVDEGADAELASPGRIPQWRALPHGLAIRDTFVAFRLADRDRVLSLDDFLFEGDLMRAPGFRELGLVPDGVAVIARGEATHRIAIEVDLGTSPMGVLAAKLEKYAVARTRGLYDELVFVLHGVRRVLEAAVAHAGLTASTALVPARDMSPFLRDRGRPEPASSSAALIVFRAVQRP